MPLQTYPKFTYIFRDLLTSDGAVSLGVNAVIGELQLTNVQFTKQINTPGTFTGDILLTALDIKKSNVINATIPSRSSVVVMADGIPVWGGIIWNRHIDSKSQKITITAREWISYFEKRKAIWQSPISYAASDGTSFIFTTGSAHAFYLGQTLSITGVFPIGYNITGTITGIPNNTSFKMANITSIAGTGQSIGGITTVTAISASAGVVTYTAPNNFLAGQSVTITGATTAAYNLTGVILASGLSSSQFKVTSAATGASSTATAIVSAALATADNATFAANTTFQIVKYLIDAAQGQTNGSINGGAGIITTGLTSGAMTAISGSGTTITYTCSNTFSVGQIVSISGSNINAYNITGTVATASSTQFTITNSGTGTWVSGGIASYGTIIAQSYYAYEVKQIMTAIDDLSKMDTGFEFLVKTTLDVSNNLLLTLSLGTPRLGNVYNNSTLTSVSLTPVFEFPSGNVIYYEYDEDGSITANKLYTIGSGNNDAKLIGTSMDYTKISISQGNITGSWPLIEDDQSYTNVTDPNLLGKLASSAMNALSYPPINLKIAVALYQDSNHIINVGDDARVRINDGILAIDAVYRIVAITTVIGEAGASSNILTLSNPTGVTI